jgi:enoyl-CoA hydratase
MSDYSDLTYLDVAVDGGIATVTLNGPEPGNALTYPGQAEISEILPRLSQDDDVAVVVATGADDAFCIGPAPDFIERVGSGEPQFVRQVMDRVRMNVQRLVDFDKVLISAINGPAHGAPMTFALMADVVIAERQVRLLDHHVPHGVAAGDGNALNWPMAMGLLRAKRYLLTGDDLSAEDAERLGLVTEVVETGASMDRALYYAHRFLTIPQPSLRYTKTALNQWYRLNMPAYERAWTSEILTVVGVQPPPTGD